MHALQRECQRLVDAGMPGTFFYRSNADGSSDFYTAGYADLETRQPMTPEHHYRVGSTTKTFTAVVLLQLVAEGKLQLQDLVQKWVPEFPIPSASTLTIEHLLRMRSGLFDFEDDPRLLGNLDAHRRPYTLEQVIQMSINHPATFPPGDHFEYCNTNFCMLERVIERITGQGLADELANRIFKPLSLAHTSYPAETDLTLLEPYVRGYERTAEGWTECSHVFFGRGDGALISTAPDIARFFGALLFQKILLPDELLQQMMTVIPDHPPKEQYGLGLILDSLQCGTLWGHSGGGFGCNHFPFLQCETGRVVIFMMNASYGYRIAQSDRPVLDQSVRCEAYNQ